MEVRGFEPLAPAVRRQFRRRPLPAVVRIHAGQEHNTRHALTVQFRLSRGLLLPRCCHGSHAGSRTASVLPRRRDFRHLLSGVFDGPDPLLAIQPEVAVGDHAGGFLEGRLGLLDQVRGSAGGSAYLRSALRTGRSAPVESRHAGRATLVLAAAKADAVATDVCSRPSIEVVLGLRAVPTSIERIVATTTPQSVWLSTTADQIIAPQSMNLVETALGLNDITARCAE